jgi:hypothetical protein
LSALLLPGVTAPVGTAKFSACGLYRYHLTRDWGDVTNRCLFVMLNPSTADADNPDPTITRCIRFAHGWGFGALDVCNLFAFRSTKPRGLLTVADPIGPENDATIARVARKANRIIAAWGANVTALKLDVRAQDVLALLAAIAKPNDVHALEWTKDDEPCHPLMLPKTSEPFPIHAWAGSDEYVARVLGGVS